MSAREQAREREAHLLFLPQDDLAGGFDRALDRPLQHAWRCYFGFLKEHRSAIVRYEI
jgi:hypothetical protein